MKSFLKKSLNFTLLLFIYFCVNLLINKLILKQSKVIDKDFNTLIIGDSHAGVSIDPNLFNSAINIALGGETVVESYWKLKYLLNRDVKFDTLIFSYSYNNISKVVDYKFSDNVMTPELMTRTILTNHFNTVDTLLNIDYAEHYKAYFRQMCLYPKADQFTFKGGYEPSDYSNLLSSSKKRISNHFFKDKKVAGVSEIAISYIDSIIDICNVNQIIPIFITTPLHKSYADNIPYEIKKQFDIEKHKLKKRDVKLLDLSMMFFPDEFYYDCDHLNKKGAEVLTKSISNAIK